MGQSSFLPDSPRSIDIRRALCTDRPGISMRQARLISGWQAVMRLPPKINDR